MANKYKRPLDETPVLVKTRLGRVIATSPAFIFEGDQGPLLRETKKSKAIHNIATQKVHKIHHRNRAVRVMVEDDGTYGSAHISLRDIDYIGKSNNVVYLGGKSGNIMVSQLSKYRYHHYDFYERRADGKINKENARFLRSLI